MVLPPLQPAEALGFIKEVLAHFRAPDTSTVGDFFPFTKDACDAILAQLAKRYRPSTTHNHACIKCGAGSRRCPDGGRDCKKNRCRIRLKKVLRDYVVVSDLEPDGDE